MVDLNDHFVLFVSEDQMAATVQLIEKYNPADISEELISDWLKANKITYGINHDAIKSIVSQCDESIFPISIAKGTEAVDGIDGKITFVSEQNDLINIDDKRDFRDIKRIPSLDENEKIAILIDPIDGEPGMTVFGKKLPYRKAKSVKMSAGKNVVYRTEDQSFYSEIKGKLSVTGNKIHVHNTYEINEDLSMKSGNINFVGSVVIRGNVPTGYRVEAEGDIHIYGLVEASYIKAGGNVTITEGVSGLKKAEIYADGDIKIGYINQAKVEAGQNVIAQNSIMHSECVAKQHIYCHSGSIIGGSCSAGVTIEANEVGNKMHTKTEITIGVDKSQFDLESQFTAARKTLISEIEKLRKLGEGLENKAKVGGGLSSKERIFLLKQKNTLQVTKNKLAKIEEKIDSLKVNLGDEEKARLIVKKVLYPNVDLQFGKYRRTTDSTHKFTQVYIEDGEIQINSL
ncbi:MAG TPA: DUF342 domain-containing protein [Bacilli bacterium]|nr:DUF342 domain-containing protein [Bacilli bacterium]